MKYVFAEELYRSGNDLYLRIPVQYNESLSLDNVVRTCQNAGLLPICRNSGESVPGDCLLMKIAENSNVWSLIKEVCPEDVWHEDGNLTSVCPKVDGTFFYEHNETTVDGIDISKGFWLETDGSLRNGGSGAYRASGENLKPYYAACAKEGGKGCRCLCFKNILFDIRSRQVDPRISDLNLQLLF